MKLFLLLLFFFLFWGVIFSSLCNSYLLSVFWFLFGCLLNPPRIEDCDVRVFVSEFFRFEYCKDFRINKSRKQHTGDCLLTAQTHRMHARA